MRLSEEKRAAILEDLEQGMAHAKIAKRHGVARSTVELLSDNEEEADEADDDPAEGGGLEDLAERVDELEAERLEHLELIASLVKEQARLRRRIDTLEAA